MNFPMKKVALYQAVISLIEDGANVNNLKVSDITNKAGIGKGTAYEYFESKEEIIGQAIAWHMKSEMDKVREQIEQTDTFRDQVCQVFDWMERMNKCRYFTLFFRMASGSLEIGEKLKNVVEYQNCHDGYLERFLNILVETARKQEIIDPSLKHYFIMNILTSQFASYMIYLNHPETPAGVKNKEMQEFLYSCMIKLLSGR